MPEALAVVLVVLVAAIVYVAAWLQARGSARIKSPADIARLKIHEAWLHERLHRAQREQWDAAMIAGLADELRATSQQLERAR